MNENKLRLATLCCFIVALLEETKLTDEVRNINNKCMAYLPNNSKELDIVANEAWLLACEYPEQPEWNPTLVAYLLFSFSKYTNSLQTEVGLKWTYFTKLAKRYDISLKAKINSLKIAKYCIESINKTIYNHKELIV